MKTAVRYYSRGGNTKKIADAAAEALGVKAETTDVPVNEDTDILFLCSSVYATQPDAHVKAFVDSLDPAKVKEIVNLSTAALLPSTYSQIEKLCSDKKLNLSKKEFHCRGSFGPFHKGHPDQKDLDDVKTFVKSFLK